MAHKESGWKPTSDAMQYKGEDVTDHAVAPGEINDGAKEPDDDE
ncbi:hypothetical protein [Halobacterium sp. CBA1126]|nr:hypothetical protein [Halobacterium sp. CBA1126]